MRVFAIDPGDRHVGFASWHRLERLAYEVDAAEAVSRLEQILGRGDLLILEEFRLYPEKAAAQSYSPMETSQMIGAMKLVARQKGADVVEQGAGIKKATRAQLRARGIKQVGEGGHARDAELHLLHYLLKEGLWRT